MREKHSINKIVSLNVISTVILEGIAMLTAPVFSRLLGTTNYGIFSLFNTWSGFLILTLGAQTSGVVPMAKSHIPENALDHYHSSVMWMSTTFFLVGSGVCLLFAAPLSNLLGIPRAAYVMMFPYAFGSFCVQYLNTKMIHDYRADVNCILSVCVAIATAGLSLLLVFALPADTNYMGRIGGMTAVYLLCGVGILIYFTAKGKTLYQADYWKFCLPLCLPLIVHGLSGQVLGQSDRVMLNYYLNESAVGIYSLAYAFSNIISIIWSSLNTAWVPFYYDYTRRGEYAQLHQRAGRYMELYTTLTLGFLLLCPDVFRVYADRSYWDGISMIPIFVIGFYFVYLYSFPVNYEFYQKRTKTIAAGTLLSGIVNLILNWIMIRIFGVFGAVFATTIARGCQFAFHYFIAARVIGKNDFPFRPSFLLTPMALVIAVGLSISWIGNRWFLVRWAIGAVLGIWELRRILQRKSLF